MSRLRLPEILAGALCLGTAASPALATQAPDLMGTNTTAWFPFNDEFQPPPSGPGPITFDKRFPYVDNRTARQTRIQPTYRIADLSNPILRPWAREQMRRANEGVQAGKVPFRPRERCYPAGVPGFVVYTLAEPFYFVQTGNQVTIINQGGPELRRIYLDVPHSLQPPPSWYGESVGHYEGGDTLVADTIAISTKSFVDNYRTPHTDKLHVIERFKLIENGKTMEDLLWVDDPGAFTTSWSAVQRFRRREAGPLGEDVCAENNANYFGNEPVPKPHADTPDF
jgi:hypothetical protein